MEYLYLFFVIIWTIWVINSIYSTNLSNKICNSYLNRNIDDPLLRKYLYRRPSSVSLIYGYHSGFSLKSWFGFKYWFKPWRDEFLD